MGRVGLANAGLRLMLSGFGEGCFVIHLAACSMASWDKP
jgi:hypothetical protein